MAGFFTSLLMLMLLLIPFASSTHAQTDATEELAAVPPYRIIGYYASWAIYGDGYFVTDIPADLLTHINYAFAFVSDEGEIALADEWADAQYRYPNDSPDQPLLGNFHQLRLLKQAHPHLQTLISIGGWTGSGGFSDVARTPDSREKFARSVAAFVTRYGFDGADIDWEYPTGGGAPGNTERPDDAGNFVLLLEALRAALDERGQRDDRHYALTIAASASPSANRRLDWSQIHPLLDWINVMTYDMSGSWSRVTGFNAPLYNSSENPPEGNSTDSAMRAFLDLGVPADKLVMGVPFYGRGWAGVRDENNGLHQPFNGLPAGVPEGSFAYHALADGFAGTYQRFWHEAAQVPWLYAADTGTMISYDDPESLGIKASYARESGFGGIMFWELSQDSEDSALLRSIYQTLNAP